MMGLANCRRCKQPYVSRNELAICNNCQSREQHLYESYYFRLIKDIATLDVEKIAKQTGLDWERLVEAIHVRLGTGGKYKPLTYWKAGICYVCRNLQSNPDSKEPICIECLDAFFKTLAHQNNPTPEEQLIPIATGGNDSKDNTYEITQARAAIAQANQQLARYRSLFGELLPQPSQRVIPYIIPSCDIDLIKWEEKTVEILNIMSLPDNALVLTNDEWLQVEIDLGLQEFMMVDTVKIKGFRR